LPNISIRRGCSQLTHYPEIPFLQWPGGCNLDLGA
jgi:hypothetical protein